VSRRSRRPLGEGSRRPYPGTARLDRVTHLFSLCRSLSSIPVRQSTARAPQSSRFSWVRPMHPASSAAAHTSEAISKSYGCPQWSAKRSPRQKSGPVLPCELRRGSSLLIRLMPASPPPVNRTTLYVPPPPCVDAHPSGVLTVVPLNSLKHQLLAVHWRQQ
jgi:hypothetical protein